MNFLIVVTGWNCKEYVKSCYDSIINQKGNHKAKAVFISDGSTDGTDKEILKLEGCYKTIGQHNKGAAFRRFQAIKELGQPDDVIMLLGMDDELLPNAMNEVSSRYEDGKLMTYGNWRRLGNASVFPRELLYFDKETHLNRDYRKVKYRATALNTFSRKLFDILTEEDFKVDGEWIKATTESPLMFACLEMCGKDRIGIIETPIYFYRQRKDSARKRLGDNYQDNIYKEIISRPKFDLI